MTNILFKKLLLLATLFFSCFEIQAAPSATTITTVTANVIPQSLFAISDDIELSIKPDEHNNKKGPVVNSGGVVMSSLNANNMTKIKINSSQNRIYDISISPGLDIAGASNKIELMNMQAVNELELLNNKEEQELIIEGVIIKPDNKYMGSYFGTVEINMNYN